MGNQKLVGIVLIVVGVLLLFFGWQASQSVAEQLTKTFTGRFSDDTTFLLIGGAAAIVAGAFLAFFRK